MAGILYGKWQGVMHNCMQWFCQISPKFFLYSIIHAITNALLFKQSYTFAVHQMKRLTTDNLIMGTEDTKTKYIADLTMYHVFYTERTCNLFILCQFTIHLWWCVNKMYEHCNGFSQTGCAYTSQKNFGTKLKIYQQVKLPTYKFYGKHYKGRV